MNAFPPDIIVLTHSHWDHAQGVPVFREKAVREHKTIEVMASEKAIPLLEDQSWNDVFHTETCENIKDVTALREGETVDLEKLTLRVYDVPGHIKDHIALFDQKTRNIFVGDSIGMKVGEGAFLPPFMPPYWQKDAFYSSIAKLRQIDFESISLAHFGYIYGEEAEAILDESVATFEQWWKLFEDNSERLSDTSFLLGEIEKSLNPVYPDFRILSPKLKALAGIAKIAMTIVRKQPPPVGKLLMKEVVEWLVDGFRSYQSTQ
jgi:glyoxylase-like metal-dependent hydrolase (beta-lactamase superfamily II)